MPEYHVVRTDKGKLDIIYGVKRPNKEPKDANEAMRRAHSEGWIPKGWTVLAPFSNEEEAQARLKTERDQERQKLADSPKPDAG